MNQSKKHIVLGVHIGHDRCAALVIGDKLVASIAEERLDRVKHSPSDSLPMLSIKYVLKEGSLSATDVDLVVLTHAGTPISSEIEEGWKRECAYLLGVKKERVVLIGHHLAHAYSAFFTSPFEQAAIAVADGGGDIITVNKYEAESYYIGKKNEIKTIYQRYQQNPIKYGARLSDYRYDHIVAENREKQISLGKKYEQLTYLIGFQFGQAGKLMGLAPYGKPFIPFDIKVSELDVELTHDDYIGELHKKYLASGQSYTEFISKHRANMAHDMQNALTHALVSLMKNLHRITGEKNLCLSGGTFLNSVANYQILQHSGFENVYIIPSAGDDGQAIGAAFWGTTKIFKKTPPRGYFSPYLGRNYSESEIKESLEKMNYVYHYFESDASLAKKVAQLLQKGNVIGILRGKSETGPRALGNRSILASPLLGGMKDHINSRIKYREDFRPFAPIVLEHRADIYFDLSCSSPYMLLVANVREQYRDTLIGITHVDGSARVQTVNQDQNDFATQILLEYEKLTGYPVLINTSYNTAKEPIVESPDDAISVLKKTELDFAVIENYLVSRESDIDAHLPAIRTKAQQL